jgi:hypothetical protein
VHLNVWDAYHCARYLPLGFVLRSRPLPISYALPYVCRCRLYSQLCCRQSAVTDDSDRVLVWALSEVIDAFYAQAEVAIYDSLAMFLFFAYCLGTRLAAVPLGSAQRFAYVERTRLPECWPVARQRLHDCSVHVLDGTHKSPSDALCGFRAQSRAPRSTASSLRSGWRALYSINVQAYAVRWDRVSVECRASHDESST